MSVGREECRFSEIRMEEGVSRSIHRFARGRRYIYMEAAP